MPHADRAATVRDAHETLDPSDWEAMRALAHRMVDDAFADLRGVRGRRAWTPMPEDAAAAFERPLPRDPEGAEAAYRDYRASVAPYPLGNDHPRFWAYYMGNGTVMGALGDFLAAMNASNLGGGAHAAALVEKQVIAWCADIVGYPREASGLLTSGASMANLIGLAVARNARAGADVREEGVGAVPRPLVVYGSSEIHSCHQRSLELLGLGHRALRRIPVDADWRIDVAALREAVARDRAEGRRPLAVVGNAGTINTGAVDDLAALADLCEAEGLWFHVDGAIGAVGALAPSLAPRLAGMERADSVALDLHKWMHVPFEAGVALLRDEATHRSAFALTPPYLQRSERGPAGAATWFSDYGPQLTRAFRALKVWLSLKQHGTDRYARLMERNLAQARRLARRLDDEPLLTRTAPVSLNIVCFRAEPPGLDEEATDAFNRELLLRIQEGGVAVPSSTTLAGRTCLRVAIANHRTTDEDLDLFVDETLRLARELAAERDGPRGAGAGAPEGGEPAGGADAATPEGGPGGA